MFLTIDIFLLKTEYKTQLGPQCLYKTSGNSVTLSIFKNQEKAIVFTTFPDFLIAENQASILLGYVILLYCLNCICLTVPIQFFKFKLLYHIFYIFLIH